jgi:hypothetical protein
MTDKDWTKKEKNKWICKRKKGKGKKGKKKKEKKTRQPRKRKEREDARTPLREDGERRINPRQ